MAEVLLIPGACFADYKLEVIKTCNFCFLTQVDSLIILTNHFIQVKSLKTTN